MQFLSGKLPPSQSKARIQRQDPSHAKGRRRQVQGGAIEPGILGLGAPTPLVALKIMSGCQGKGAKMASLRVTPDTGATVDVIKHDIAKKIGAQIEPNSSGY